MGVFHLQIGSDAAGRAEAPEEMQDKAAPGSAREDTDPRSPLLLCTGFRLGMNTLSWKPIHCLMGNDAFQSVPGMLSVQVH